jgi:outer membrane receptor protein involved in Fe transport
MQTKAILCGVILGVASAAPAYALRPFDGTDADVARPGVMELELGYLGYLRKGPQKSVIAPAAVLNFGLEHDYELVTEGRVRNRLHPGADTHQHLHRTGVLQDADGPSIASECGILLPTVEGERTGAACTGILSQRWGSTTVHFNAALGKNREGSWEKLLDGIVVGPGFGIARPVLETFIARDSAGGYTNSALGGVVWAVKDNLSFDVGLRKARTDTFSITELRVEFTWSRPLHH